MSRAQKKSGLLAALLGIALLQPVAAPACTVCFGGASNDALTQGMGWGIFTLLCIILSVLGGVALFFVHVVRRSAAPAHGVEISLPNSKN